MHSQMASSGSVLLWVLTGLCSVIFPPSVTLCVLFCSREIWARFLAFESNIGDLASILKVEKRRFTAFKEEYEGKETALLVDRYKFMDLYPCSASELKALGYKVRTLQFIVVLLSPKNLGQFLV